MKNWNDLSIKDRTKYIKLGIDNGVTDLQTIRNAYNSFAEGGHTAEDDSTSNDNTIGTTEAAYYTVSMEEKPGRMEEKRKYARGGFLPMNYPQYEEALSQYWGEDLSNHDYDYRQYYNDNPIEALAQLEMLRSGGYGHFPDGRNGRIYKTLDHPTSPDLAEDSWSDNDTTFNISSRQLDSDDPYYNTDRTLDYLGSDLNYNKGGTNVMYDDGYVLPTLYVTPPQ